MSVSTLIDTISSWKHSLIQQKRDFFKTRRYNMEVDTIGVGTIDLSTPLIFHAIETNGMPFMQLPVDICSYYIQRLTSGRMKDVDTSHMISSMMQLESLNERDGEIIEKFAAARVETLERIHLYLLTVDAYDYLKSKNISSANIDQMPKYQLDVIHDELRIYQQKYDMHMLSEKLDFAQLNNTKIPLKTYKGRDTIHRHVSVLEYKQVRDTLHITFAGPDNVQFIHIVKPGMSPGRIETGKMTGVLDFGAITQHMDRVLFSQLPSSLVNIINNLFS